MALSGKRVVAQGLSRYPHEQEAIAFARDVLPDVEPYRMWALVELHDPSGRRYEIDMLILGYHALYVVEVKSHPARISGNVVDWVFTFPDAGVSTRENPLRGLNHKAKVLASLLERKMGRDRPWVEPLVFLSHPDATVELNEAGRQNVVCRDRLARAVTFGDVPGAGAALRSRLVNRKQAAALVEALQKLGLRESRGALKLREYVFDDLIEEGPGYQDHVAHHEQMTELRRRIRTYLVPQSPTPERRAQLQRAATREARLLADLGAHQGVLQMHDFVPEGPLGGPCLIFEHVPDAEPLDAFLRRHPDLPFSSRVTILEEVGLALDYCHARKVLHRGLHPGAVLVRVERGVPRVKLHSFQLASRAEGSQGTAHLSDLAPDRSVIYRAPEVIENPGAATPASDVFALGALAYLVFTGRQPGDTLAERQRLISPNGLSVAATRDDLAATTAPVAWPHPEDEERWRADSIDAVVRLATHPNPLERADSAIAFVNLLLEAATAPAAPAPHEAVDPLEAKPGDRLGRDLDVISILGAGTTSRVFLVRRDRTELALKVPVSDAAEGLLRDEASVLSRLLRARAEEGSDRVAHVVEAEVKLGKRTCLLTTYAGENLAQVLARDGIPSLDYAERWGQDLLLALAHLEAESVHHRDVKPANLGVMPRSTGKTRNLRLFDFSLASIDPSITTVGTPAYRDPFVITRERWDHAADHYSAAVTLHEMLTGRRPRWRAGAAAAATTDDEVAIDSERFDASIRDRLTIFFRKALSRRLDSRHQSAREMLDAWLACFFTRTTVVDGETAQLDLGRLTAEAPVASLPLSARAKNALDRAGCLTTGDLLRLPKNQLSAMRGVGRETAQQILSFIEAYEREHSGHLAERSTEPPFCPGYAGPDSSVKYVADLSAAAALALDDAGLGHMRVLAAAPASRVQRVLSSHEGAASILLDHLKQGSRDPKRNPPTIEAWLDGLLSGKKAFMQHARWLLRVDPHEGILVADAKELSKRLGVTPTAIHVSLTRAREEWRGHPALPDLALRVESVLAELGGVAPLERAAEGLPLYLPHDFRIEDGQQRVRNACALLRIAAELDFGATLGRLEERLWLYKAPDTIPALRRLGEVADDLAREQPLPSAPEVEERLREVAARTPLAPLRIEHLTTVACEASHGAAASARLEIYPRGMDPARTLSLAAGAFAGLVVRTQDIHALVRARYPEAAPLPERPALDELMSSLDFVWSPELDGYQRRASLTTAASETLGLASRRTSTPATHRPPLDPVAQEAEEVERALRLAAERRYFRVCEVLAPHALVAARELAARLGVEPISLDRELLEALDQLRRELEIEEHAVFEADREGERSEFWPLLIKLMEQSAARVLDRLARRDGPLVLVHPGLLARYGLHGFLSDLVKLAGRDDGPAVFLIVSTNDEPGPVPIRAVSREIPVPTTSPAQRLRLTPWIEYRYRGRSSAREGG